MTNANANSKHYYEATVKNKQYGWKVYHYDTTGEKEIIVGRGEPKYDTENQALDAAGEWMEENDIDAELM